MTGKPAHGGEAYGFEELTALSKAGAEALKRIAAATSPDARLFIDGGNPLRELTISSP